MYVIILEKEMEAIIILSVRDNVSEIVVKNSRFICLLYHVDDISLVDDYRERARDLYKDARHYCYAYIISGKSKCSDDKEPSGTAGIPMLQVLLKNKLDNVLCIVVRYFGGTLLGAGGLIRAYTKSVTNCLDGSIVSLDEGYNIIIEFNYNLQKKIDYIIHDCAVLRRQYLTSVVYEVNVKKDVLDKLLKIDGCLVKIKAHIYL